jgi:hypothetical protein
MMKVMIAIDKPYVMPIEVAQLKSESAGAATTKQTRNTYHLIQ